MGARGDSSWRDPTKSVTNTDALVIGDYKLVIRPSSQSNRVKMLKSFSLQDVKFNYDQGVVEEGEKSEEGSR